MILHVVRPGTLTTVQDLGRPGRGRLGVSPSGAMDRVALRVANALLANAPGAAALEVTGPGLVLEIEGHGRLALAGADLDTRLDGHAVPAWGVVEVGPGARLTCEGRRRGARLMLAVPGGLDVPLVLGSASTDLDAGLGGVAGRALRRGDTLRAHGSAMSRGVRHAAVQRIRSIYDDAATLAFVPSTGAAMPGAYTVSPRSSRMGYRLEGPPLDVGAGDAISEPIAPGAIQVTADGLPVLLMADRQTVGGYPVAGHVVRAHLPRAAQLWPGDGVSFAPVTLDEAHRLSRALERDLAEIEA